MKISVDLNGIGESLETLIEKKLRKKGLPTCIGSMAPPIVQPVVELDAEDIFKPSKDIPSDNLAEANLAGIVSQPPKFMNDYAMDVNGKAFLIKHKERICAEYVEHIVKCSECAHRTLCEKLTYYYLTSIKLLELSRG